MFLLHEKIYVLFDLYNLLIIAYSYIVKIWNYVLDGQYGSKIASLRLGSFEPFITMNTTRKLRNYSLISRIYHFKTLGF